MVLIAVFQLSEQVITIMRKPSANILGGDFLNGFPESVKKFPFGSRPHRPEGEFEPQALLSTKLIACVTVASLHLGLCCWRLVSEFQRTETE